MNKDQGPEQKVLSYLVMKDEQIFSKHKLYDVNETHFLMTRESPHLQYLECFLNLLYLLRTCM